MTSQPKCHDIDQLGLTARFAVVTGVRLTLMPAEASMRDVLRNSLQYGDLSFRDFVELALYHPEFGYYATARSPVGKAADFVTSPAISPVFACALSRLVREFVSRNGDEPSDIVDVGCGDGELIRALARLSEGKGHFTGIDRALSRADSDTLVTFADSIDRLPPARPRLIFSNELFDALPFARLVMRGEHLHELWVSERDGVLDWSEHEAPAAYDDYFAAQGIALTDGQFADVSLEWGPLYADLCRATARGLIVTFDYGFPRQQLFHSRIRRFGTAAAYSQQRVTRDLLANPGEQDLTAHINFSDLIDSGEREGFKTLFFDRQAKFLLSLGITEHELFAPIETISPANLAEGVDLLDARDQARRLVLPDGIGEDIRVLVQGKGIALENWSFQRDLF
ncbi:MAG: SAM-dependent methyltransferase, MidA family [Acidobacteria bacterium]|nr:SAM-dependent methyltransferase, MidA family [Acidobacteriota bacterium]